MPKASSSILAMGAAQLVVQLALLIMRVCGVDDMIVDAGDQCCGEFALGRDTQHNALRAPIQMLCQLVNRPVVPGRFDNVFNAQFLPRQLFQTRFTEHLKRIIIDSDLRTSYVHRPGIDTMDGIVFERVREIVDSGQVVHSDDVVMPAQFCNSRNGSADSPEAVDCYSRLFHFFAR